MKSGGPGDDGGDETHRGHADFGGGGEVGQARSRDHGGDNSTEGGFQLSEVPAPGATSDGRLRFLAEGGSFDRVRARSAGPLLMAGSWAVAAAAAIGPRHLVHSLERGLGRLAERLAALRLDAAGLERVDPSERYVVVALHEGFADALALLRLPLGLRFAARDELFDRPALGRYLISARHLRVDTARSLSSVRRFYRDSARVFDEGDSLVIFAQGSILGVEIAFQKSPPRLARRFGRPLLPVVVTGSHRVWEHPYSPAVRFRERVSMRVLDPIPSTVLDSVAFRQIERDMKRIALGGAMAPVRRYRPDSDGWWDGYAFEIDPDFPELRARVAAHREAPRSVSGFPGAEG